MSPAAESDVLIVGGGPVGLLLANLLGAQAVRTLLVERRTAPPSRSMAIGITPPSLAILKNIQLDECFSREGLRVTHAWVHEGRHCLGCVDFTAIPSDYPYILTIPQARTVELLRSNLRRYPSVTCLTGVEFLHCQESGDQVVAQCAWTNDSPPLFSNAPSPQLSTLNPQPSTSLRLSARYLAGCDGHRSRVRASAGMSAQERFYPQRFVMADCEDHTGLGREAHLFFNASASIESFPLPGGKRRWIVLAAGREPSDPRRYVIERVRQLTGHHLRDRRLGECSRFESKHMLVHKYYSGCVLLAGDAAHVMSPIGGQGMNTGFADAEFLAEMLPRVLSDPVLAGQWFPRYDQARRQAFTAAARRAALGMWLGTRRGPVFSFLRRHFIGRVLFAPWMAPKLAPYFAMLTLPSNAPFLSPTQTSTSQARARNPNHRTQSNDSAPQHS